MRKITVKRWFVPERPDSGRFPHKSITGEVVLPGESLWRLFDGKDIHGANRPADGGGFRNRNDADAMAAAINEARERKA